MIPDTVTSGRGLSMRHVRVGRSRVKIDKARFAEEAPKVREGLLDAQYDLAKSGRFPVVIVVGGVDGAGKGEVVNLLSSWPFGFANAFAPGENAAAVLSLLSAPMRSPVNSS